LVSSLVANSSLGRLAMYGPRVAACGAPPSSLIVHLSCVVRCCVWSECFGNPVHHGPAKVSLSLFMASHTAQQLPIGALSRGGDEHMARLLHYRERLRERERLEWSHTRIAYGSSPAAWILGEDYGSSPFSFPSSLFCARV
jgi:hypothetical protein